MSYMFNLEDYETVEERLVKYWKDHPDGQIHTSLLDSSGGRYIVIAQVYRTEADARPWTTGLAEETVAGRGVNATSALENCETSAIGRALANAGYATKGKRASREEMSKVQSKNVAQSAIAEVKAKMAQTATEYVPVPKEEDPWTIKEGAPVQTMDGAVDLLKQEMGARTEKDIPSCPNCHDGREMTWKTGVSQKTKKPWGNFSCFTCKETIWYEIVADGSWKPQKAKW
jgi:hypothetical protein